MVLPRLTPTLILFVSLIACTSQPQTQEIHILPARFAEEGQQKPMVALEAFHNKTQFYIRYQVGEEIFYTGGEWTRRIDLETPGIEETLAGPYILPLQYHRTSPWKDTPTEPISATILSSKDWQSLRNSFFSAILPKGEPAGIVLHFYVDDYFLYFDENGVFHSTVLLEKPADYEIRERVTFPEFLEKGAPFVEEFLKFKGISDRRILFNTADTGAYSLPFMFVDLDLRIAVFLRHEPQGREHDPGRTIPVIQAAGHVGKSHSASMVVRPVSSIYRLLFVAKGAVSETARPDWLIELESSPMAPIYQGPGMDLDAWELSLDILTGRKSSKGTIEYLIDGEEFFTRFIDAVTKAQKSILLRTYLFDNDDYAERIGELLKRRSNEGIEVKMLFDGLGTIASTIEQQQTLPSEWKGTASVRDFLESDSQIEVRQAPNPWFTGDHVKTILIDRQIAFTGGMNIAREYRYDWHDLMMEVRGPVVDILQQEFHKAWVRSGFLGDLGVILSGFMPVQSHAENVGHPIRVLFTRIDDPEIFRAQREAIRHAKRYVFVQNAYLTDDAMLYELVKARRRGVDVRIIMPIVTDRGPITRHNALAANIMLEHGIRVYIYPGMSHMKAAIFDGWACLGSANWDNWSLAINRELNLATSHPTAVDELIKRVFEADFVQSRELTEPFPERWSDFLLEFIGDYIF